MRKLFIQVSPELYDEQLKFLEERKNEIKASDQAGDDLIAKKRSQLAQAVAGRVHFVT